MNADQTREALTTEAAKLGFSVERIDLRAGRFVMVRGSEARSLGSIGRDLMRDPAYYVQATIEGGFRLDHIVGSSYYAA
jgi:hypothetical protein